MDLTQPKPVTLNIAYLKSLQSALKLIQLICNTVITIVVGTQSTYYDREKLQTPYLIASIGSLILCSVIFLIRIHNINKLIRIPWSKLEISYYIIWTIYYFIVIAQSTSVMPYKVAQIFSLICVIAFVIDIIECYGEINKEKCSCDTKSSSNENNEEFKDIKTLVI